MNEAPVDPVRDALKAKGWDKRWLFSTPFDDAPEVEQQRRQVAVTRYMLRSLSRGRLPDAQLIADALGGAKQVPECGWLNCLIGFEHVH